MLYQFTGQEQIKCDREQQQTVVKDTIFDT